jgi:glycosyltransferase involved in cell wall biosynthesis
VVFTDHSLFGFADAAGIHINQVCMYVCMDGWMAHIPEPETPTPASVNHPPPHTHTYTTPKNNKQVMRFILSDVDHCICVSNTCRENLALRARLHPSLLSTIPNAVDPDKFAPRPRSPPPTNDDDDGAITIVIVSRLVYRKGACTRKLVCVCICVYGTIVGPQNPLLPHT